MSPRFDQSKFIKRAKEGLQTEIASPDHILVQVVSSIDELNKISNLMYERLTEWYGLHFPEFKHKEPVKYVQVALAFDRAHPDKQKLAQIVGPNADSILHQANNSVGVHFSDEDMQMLREEARTILMLFELKEKQEKYADALATRLAPNISELAGPAVAAKLIAHAGGLKKLASMPSSTIQVIGAEKALFKHLKSGSPPPKHGLIFQHPLISTATRRARGRIARALAAKITIASKADAFTKHNIAALLKEKFEARAQDILNKTKNDKDVPSTRPPQSYPRRYGGGQDRGDRGSRPWQGGNRGEGNYRRGSSQNSGSRYGGRDERGGRGGERGRSNFRHGRR
ncbi:MAG: NOP5/NOP56 family protein [Candidatus Micrarchaeia archaeon]